MKNTRTDVAADLITAMVSNYQCGSCGGTIEALAEDAFGLMQAAVRHDDDCPVLAGHVSAAGDFARAATIPDTFRR